MFGGGIMKFRRLNASEIDARVATVTEKGCSLLLYKDARVDMNILDETVGPMNWQRSHQLIGDRLYCTVSVWDGTKSEWISKQDVGTESYTEKEKGQASDSFKRACFNLGIGRELYTAPFIWIKPPMVNLIPKGDKYTTYDRFIVKTIGYDNDGNINKLTIVNDKDVVVYTYGKAETPEEKMVERADDKITTVQLKAVLISIEKNELKEDKICEYFGIKRLEDMTMGQLTQFNKMVEKSKKEKK